MEEINKDTKILITGVHFTPSYAVLQELESRGYKNFVWVGQKRLILGTKEPSLEYKKITEKNITFVDLITGKLQRTFDLTFFLWLARIPVGFFQALFVLLKHKPKLIITFGSYVAVPVAFWGWVLRIPVICHEQTIVGGLANTIISKLSTKVCLSWKNEKKEKNKKYVYTGNPLRKEIFENNTNEYSFADNSRKLIFITAGKTGSHTINMTIFAAIEKLVRKYNVIHQVGINPTNDIEHAQTIAQELNENGVKYLPIINFQGGEALNKADLIISRSGANITYEFAALGKIAIFIPIPFTQKDEQNLNAKLLEEAGTARILHQNVLTPDTLQTLIEDIFSSYETMKACTSLAKELVVFDADKRIADIVEEEIAKIKNPKQEVEKIQKNVEEIKEEVKEIIEEVKEELENKPEVNEKKKEEVIEKVEEINKEIEEKSQEVVKNPSENIVNKTTEYLKAAEKRLDNIFNSVKSGFNNIKDKAKEKAVLASKISLKKKEAKSEEPIIEEKQVSKEELAKKEAKKKKKKSKKRKKSKN